MRLLVPGYEGNMNVKWLHRIKLVEEPVMAINETLQYTYRVAGPKIWQFFFPMEVKSFITHPSPGLTLKGPGFYEISGLAYSGNGRIAKVMVSADGGKSWARGGARCAGAAARRLTRFRMPWRWDGQPVVLQSRAWDEAGNVQPTRAEHVCRARRTQGQPPRHRVPDGAHERDHQLGDRQQWGGEACLCVRALRSRPRSRLRCLPATAIAADGPGLGQKITEADLALWDISIGPDGKGLPAGSGTSAARRRDLRAEMRTLPRQERRRRDQLRARQRARQDGTDHGTLCAERHHDIRLHAARDAVAAAEVAH